ncbi:MAG: DUF1634 domain-containing protein [Halobacteriota archaeon]
MLLCSAVSMSVCLIGIVLFAASPTSRSDAPMPLKDILVGLKSPNPASFTAAGVLLTIASPFAWVAVTSVHFAARRNLLYSFISGLVLSLMLLSLAVALT